MTKTKRISKSLYWAPRIMAILLTLFLSVFSLDVFGNGYTFWETVLALLMHNIPVFILAAIVVISWKREIVGGIAFILAGLFYIALQLMRFNWQWYMLSWSIIIAGPAFLIGILFLMNWFRKKKK